MKYELFGKKFVLGVIILLFIPIFSFNNVYGISVNIREQEIQDIIFEKQILGTEYWALLFAVGVYKNHPNQDRPSMLEAVEDFYDVLLDSPQWHADHIHKVTATDCTLGRLIQELKWLVENVKSDDMAIVYLTTHGSPLKDPMGNFLDIPPLDEADGADEALIMYDGFDNDYGFIWDDLLNFYLNQLKGKGLCLIVDSCHSGGFNDELKNVQTLKINKNIFLNKILNKLPYVNNLLNNQIMKSYQKTTKNNIVTKENIYDLNELEEDKNLNIDRSEQLEADRFTQGFIEELAAKGRIVLMSSEEDTLSWGSHFSNYLIQACDEGNWADINGNNDGRNSAEEAFIYAKPRVEDVTDGRQHPTILDKFEGEYLMTFTKRNPIQIYLPNGFPDVISPGESINIAVEINEITDSYVPGSGKMYYRYDVGSYIELSLVHIDGELYEATLPLVNCGDIPEFYFSAEGESTGVIYSPEEAPDMVYSSLVGELTTVFTDNFESDTGWTVENACADGEWERGDPVGWNRGDPSHDYDGSGNCYLTDNNPNDENCDVDDGTTWLISPTIDLSHGIDGKIDYALWYTNNFGNDPNNDLFKVYISNNNGANWILAEIIGPETSFGWNERSFMISDFVTPTNRIKVRFEASDLNEGSVVEAGIDDFNAYTFDCN